jgi:hypothetical protein
MAVVTVIGDGANTLFWKDKWHQGKRIKEIAPAVYDMVPKRTINNRKVSEALLNLKWISDFLGALTLRVAPGVFPALQVASECGVAVGTPVSC